jgi:arabinofuranosyltransferase
MTTKHLYWLLVPISLAFLTGLVLHMGYWTDDSLIACRYAENLVDFGQLVYNRGEAVSSLTSPMHTLLEALLYWLTGHTLLAWQVTAFACVLVSFAALWHRFRSSPPSVVVIAVVLLASPCIILWSFGGLETNLLLLWVTLLALAAWTERPMTAPRLCAVFFLAGVCFVTRYDSVLFTGPVVLFAALRSRRIPHIAIAVLVGAILPAAWLIFAKSYYGDIFPTSYYIKKPTLYLRHPQMMFSMLWTNGSYMLQYLITMGIIPFAVLWFFIRDKSIPIAMTLGRGIRSHWGIVGGLAVVLAYGLLVATTHMMYAFRFFIPYVPAVLVLLAAMYARITPQAAPSRTSRAKATFVTFVIIAAILQACHSSYMYTRSMNGFLLPVAHYEFSAFFGGSRDHLVNMHSLEAQADDIRRHWNSLQQHPARPPRIWTFAGGTTPYYYRDAYIFESLASYRRYVSGDLRPCADYMQLGTATGMVVPPPLPGPASDYVLISKRSHTTSSGMTFDRWVYYNPHPLDSPLPPRINDRPTGSRLP